MRRLIFSLFAILAIYGKLDAQSNVFDLLNKPMYEARVKLVDEFMARFNGLERRTGVPEEYSDRKSNVLMLFDFKQFKSKQDSLFLMANKFAQIVVDENIKLNYADSCWYAKVKCHGTMARKEVDFYLYLIVESRGTDMYKWSIANAEGEVFNTSRNCPHRELFLSPNDHETSFMSLSKITDGAGQYIDDYAKDGYEADPLSVFLTLVRIGQLKINHVSDVEFVFLQVPGYTFSVKHFERESLNVGWLISSFERCDDNDKASLLANIRIDRFSKESCIKMEDESKNLNADSDEKQVEILHSEAEKVVNQFGIYINKWLETEDFRYQELCSELCSGTDGRDCFVNDSLMLTFAKLSDLPVKNTYLLSSYLVGFQKAKRLGKCNFQITDIRVVDIDDKSAIVSCRLLLSGKMPIDTRDLFYVRRSTNKIYRISSSVPIEKFNY